MLKDMSTGSWAEYLVKVPADGTYDLYLRLACKAGSKIDIYEDDRKITTLQPTATATSDFDHWQTQSFPLSLTAGRHRLKLYSTARLFYYEWLSVGAPTEDLDQCSNHKYETINHKYIKNGQFFIRTANADYNVLGQKIQ